MSRIALFALTVLALALAACSSNEPAEPAAGSGPATTTSPTAAAIAPTAPPPLVATNTFIPLVEVQPTATDTATPTLTATVAPTDTATPARPIAAVALEPVIAGGLTHPTFVTHAFDERLFVLEQIGRIRIIDSGQLLADPFLDITDRVGSVASEQGLLGLAFHPNYATAGAAGEGTFYVNYTDYSGDTHISRFTVSPDDANRADPDSEIIYLTQDQPYPNHNGGSLVFGPDGYLYAGLGDGGSANDPLAAGQRRDTWLGKILRIDVTVVDGEYVIPAGNPFVDEPGALAEIWAYGLRNPWRFSFDRATGDMFIADVGQNMWEEVNWQPADSPGGENYGWVLMEASHCFGQETCNSDGLELPIFEYAHSQGCSVTGGYVYRGRTYPEMTGNYFVADYCTGVIWRLFAQANGWLADVAFDSDVVISTFGEGVDGELYVADYVHGAIYRLTPDE